MTDDATGERSQPVCIIFPEGTTALFGEQELWQAGALTVSEFLKLYKISRPTFYQEVRSGRLRTIKLNRARRITLQAARDWSELREALTNAHD